MGMAPRRTDRPEYHCNGAYALGATWGLTLVRADALKRAAQQDVRLHVLAPAHCKYLVISWFALRIYGKRALAAEGYSRACWPRRMRLSERLGNRFLFRSGLWPPGLSPRLPEEGRLAAVRTSDEKARY